MNPILERAINLLAIVSGSAPSEGYIRTFTFNSNLSTSSAPSPAKVTVTLRDGNISSSEHEGYNSVGVQTWGSANVLSQKLISNGLLTLPRRPPNQSLRILELGAGTGLVSLVVANFLTLEREGSYNEAPEVNRVEIIASDHDRAVLDNLESNIELNAPFGESISIWACYLDWKSFASPYFKGSPNSPIVAIPDPPFDEPFDLILGADVVYEPHQAFWLKATVEALLSEREPHLPSPSTTESITLEPPPRFHLVIPLRATHSHESKSVFEAFPRLETDPSTGRLRGPRNGGDRRDDFRKRDQNTPYPSRSLGIISVEEIEVEDRRIPLKYLYLEIGWSDTVA